MKVISRLFILLLTCNAGFLGAVWPWPQRAPVVNLQNANQRECIICRENKPNADFGRLALCCGQEVCVDCLAQVRLCPFCRVDFSPAFRIAIQNKYLEKYPNRSPEAVRRSLERRRKLGVTAAAGVALSGLYLTYKLYNKIYRYHPDDYDTSTASRKIMHSALIILKHISSALLVWSWPGYRLGEETNYKIKNVWRKSKSSMPSELELWKQFNDKNAAVFGCIGSLAAVAGCAFSTYSVITRPSQGENLPAIFH